MSMKKIGPIEMLLKLDNDEIDTFALHFYKSKSGRYVVATKGDISDGQNILLRIESSCIFGHVFNSVKCDCNFQLKKSMELISEDGRGILIYAIDQDAIGTNIETHFRVYELRQHEKLEIDKVHRMVGIDVDKRDYSDVIHILSDFGVKSVKILTNNEERVEALRQNGIEAERIPLVADPDEYNINYLRFKKLLK